MAEAAAQPDPHILSRLALRTLAPGRWWRVHAWDASTGVHGAAAFNASGLGDARFSPLADAAGRPIPTLYAAAALEAALMETVLHDVPYPSHGHLHDLARDLDGPLHASVIVTTVPLDLVDLGKLGLQRAGLKVPDLFETDAIDYPRTRRWASALHAAFPHAQGLAWMSVRHPEHLAWMAFGDRIAPGAIAASGVAGEGPRPLRHAQLLATLLGLLSRLGCGVAPDR